MRNRDESFAGELKVFIRWRLNQKSPFEIYAYSLGFEMIVNISINESS